MKWKKNGPKEPRKASEQLKGEFQGDGLSVSDHIIHQCSSQSGLQGEHHCWEKNKLHSDKEFKRMSCGESRQKLNFSASWCSGAALLHLIQGVLNLCRIYWNLKTTQEWRRTKLGTFLKCLSLNPDLMCVSVCVGVFVCVRVYSPLHLVYNKCKQYVIRRAEVGNSLRVFLKKKSEWMK